jgi:hypothetical protein
MAWMSRWLKQSEGQNVGIVRDDKAALKAFVVANDKGTRLLRGDQPFRVLLQYTENLQEVSVEREKEKTIGHTLGAHIGLVIAVLVKQKFAQGKADGFGDERK